MAKNSIRDYSATNSSNTDIQSIDISEGCSPAGINNAIREVMADLKDVSTGAVALESPAADSLTVTGDLTVDTNTLYVDSTNNRVGVGTASPTGSLDVEAASGDATLRVHAAENNSSSEPILVLESSNDFAESIVEFKDSSGVGGRVVYNHGDNALRFQTNGLSERMRIDSSGKVGIGTSSPTDELHVATASASSTTDITIENTNASGQGCALRLKQANSNANSKMVFDDGGTESGFVFDGGANSVLHYVNGSERLRIDSSGNVKVNTTSSLGSAKFFVEADTTTVNPISVINTRASAATDYHMLFYRAGSLVGSIQTSLSATSYVTSSDYRLKTNVNYDWDATTRLKQLRPARFEWIADGDDAVPVDGFLAHEVQEIVPEAISGTKDAMRDEEYEVTPAVLDEDGNVVTPAVMGTRSVPDYQGIDQSKLVPLLVKTIQELEARITALEAN